MENDSKERFMRAAIELAKKGEGWTNPNPLVGAVIVKENQIIGQGYHHKYGDLHAERDALRDCRERGNDSSGAQIFVTLEPCCHTGKQPPCVEAIVEAGIKKVVVGSRDPNPLVSGKGAAFLRERGVEVEEDFLRSECDALNFIFFHYITNRTPYVALKYAMTADGKICTATGKSRWVTGEAARRRTHEDRNRYAAIMVGVGTVLADDPLLTCRVEGGRDPVRVICDTNLRMPQDAQIVKTAKDVPTIIATAVSDPEALAPFIHAGCGIVTVPKRGPHIDLKALMKALGERQIDSVILEGGATLNASAVQAGILNRVQAYIAPKIFGGKDALTPLSGEGVKAVSESFCLELAEVEVFGDDVLMRYRVK